MKLAIVALSLALAAAAPSSATPTPSRVQRAFGNTVVSTYPDGRTALLWLKPDGSYEAKGRRRTPSSGAWSVKGERMCLKQLKPMRAPFSYCTALPAGTSWRARAVTGEPIKVTIVRGIKAS